MIGDEDYRELFEIAADAMFIVGDDLHILNVNAAACALVGRTKSEMVGQSIADMVPPDLSVTLRDRHAKVQENGYLLYESALIRKDGAVIPLEVANRAIELNGQKAYFGVARDIRERKRIEHALQDNDTALRAILETTRDGYWHVDSAWRLLDVNQAYCDLSGYTREELLGMRIADLDVVADDKFIAEKHALLVQSGHACFETRHRRKDGSIWDVEVSTSYDPITRNQFFTFLRDISERKRQEAALRDAKLQMETIIDNVPAMIFLKRADDLRFELLNRAGEEMLGYGAADLIGKNDYDFFPHEQSDFFSAQDRRALGLHTPLEIPEEAITTARGETRYLHTRKIALRDASGKATHLLGVSVDISERKRTEAELRLSATALESREGLVITDAHMMILRVNRAFTEITGYTAEEAVGQTPRILQSGRHDAAFYRAMWESIEQTGSWQGEIWDKRKNGEIFPKWLTITAVKDEHGKLTNYIGAQFDISERKKAEDKINELAFFDQLTGLPNRTLLMDRLRQAMISSARSGEHGALMFIDLDHFKTLNDTLGHDAGDKLLKQVARRLTACVRTGDTVARLGGDEFVILLVNLNIEQASASAQAETIGRKILSIFHPHFTIGEASHHSTPSIGITLFGKASMSVDQIFKQADLAMYRAKEAGRNTLRFFDTAMETAAMHRAVLEQDLQDVIRRQQLQLHYQPQITDGQLVGVEALVRWLHPQQGPISPAEFIPLAEETGLILSIGQWVLETACRQLVAWTGRPGFGALTIAVNISVHQFRQRNFVDHVLETLERTGANPRRLKLELTESQLISNIEEIIDKMTALKMCGVGFSLDDFGTGYSSLSYLKRLPLDQLKIDQSFVRDVLVDSGDATIARSIIALGQSLGLAVIAEGVENEAQREFLADAGCHAYQGFLFSRALTVEALEEFSKGWAMPADA